MPERFQCTSLAKKALYKYSSFSFLNRGCLVDLYYGHKTAVADVVVSYAKAVHC